MVELTQEIVREFLHYNSRTGVLIWKWRARKWFRAKRNWTAWNRKFAGKPAFTSVHVQGYLTGPILGKRYLAHRVIFLWMKGRWPEPEVDHDDQDQGNNRWKNLKEATAQQNNKNHPKRHDNRSGVTGVFRNPWGFVAYISVDGRRVHLGSFKSFGKAVAIRKEAEREYGFSVNHGS